MKKLSRKNLKIFFVFIYVILIMTSKAYSNPQVDRWDYINWGKLIIHSYLSGTLLLNSGAFDFSTKEKELLEKLVKYIEQRATRVENERLVYDFSTPFILSEDRTLFKLSPQEPERAAVTTHEPDSPIYFNKFLINSSQLSMNCTLVLQLILHELGRKVTDPSEIQLVDQFTLKIVQSLQSEFAVRSINHDTKIIYPIKWSTVITNAQSSFFKMAYLVERSQKAYLFENNITVHVPYMKSDLFVPSANLSMDTIPPEKLTLNGLEVIPARLQGQTTNPSILFNYITFKVADTYFNQNSNSLELNGQIFEHVINVLKPSEGFLSLYYNERNIKVMIDLNLLNYASKTYSYEAEDKILTQLNRKFDLEAQITEQIDFLGLKYHTFKVHFKNEIPQTKNVQLIIESLSPGHKTEFTLLPKPLSYPTTDIPTAEYDIDTLNEIYKPLENESLKAIGILINDKEKVLFRESVPIRSSRTRSSRAYSDPFKITGFKLVKSISNLTYEPWIPTPVENFEKNLPNKKYTKSSIITSFVITLDKPKILRSVDVFWSELIYLQYNDVPLGFLRVPRYKRFFYSDFSLSTAADMSQTEIIIAIEGLLSMDDPELISRLKPFRAMGIKPSFTGITAITNIQIRDTFQSVNWSEYGPDGKRSVLVVE